MEYFEILLLVLMALVGLVILALVVGSGHRAHPQPRHDDPRSHRSRVPAPVADLHHRPGPSSLDDDPRGQEVIRAE
jgi:hypothetical protein